MKRIFTVLFVCAVFVSCGDDVTYEYKDIDNPVPEYTPTLSGKAVSGAEELAKIGVNDEYPPDGEYYLSCDIDLTQIEWTPIGSEEAPFAGILNGNGKKITLKLKTGDTEDKYTGGLFRYTNFAIIENLKIELTTPMTESVNLTADTDQYIGTLAAVAKNSIIKNIEVNGADSGAGIYSIKSGGGSHYAGGVFGEVNSGFVSGIVSRVNIKTETSVTQGYQYTGGISGAVKNGAALTTCKAENNSIDAGAATDATVYTGGLVGYSTRDAGLSGNNLLKDCASSVTKVISTGTGAGDQRAGGIAGHFTIGEITNCSLVSEASIEASSTGNSNVYAGGIAGSLSQSSFTGNFINAAATVKALSEGTGYIYAGGLTGYQDATEAISKCYISAKVKVDAIKKNIAATSNIYVGGIAGQSPITNSYSCADVKLTTDERGGTSLTAPKIRVGGLAGDNINSLIEYSYSAGKVEIENTHESSLIFTGGIVGGITNNKNSAIQYCFAANSAITVTSSNTGDNAVTVNRIAAKKLGTTNGTLERNYASPALVIKKIISGIESDIPQTNNINDVCGSSNLGASGADESFFSGTLGWDFTNIWAWDSALGLPVLR